MRHTTRVGLFCACIGLLAPRVFGDAIMLEGKTFSSQSEVFLIEVEQGQSGDDGGGFTLELCSHCKVKAEGPFLFNPNLSMAAFSRDFFAPFSGASSLNSPAAASTPMPPTALLSSSINAIATQSTAAPVTNAALPSTSSSTSQPVAPAAAGDGTTPLTLTAPPATKAADPFAANPEPATVLLLGTGLAAGALGRRKLRGPRT
jgi:hypothetical protein